MENIKISAASTQTEMLNGLSKACDLLLSLGDTYRQNLNDPNAALAAYEEALSLSLRCCDTYREALALNLIGLTHLQLGHEEAQDYFLKACEATRASGNNSPLN